jgi:hypothetical protein
MPVYAIWKSGSPQKGVILSVRLRPRVPNNTQPWLMWSERLPEEQDISVRFGAVAPNKTEVWRSLAERASLENWRPRKGFVSSNLTASTKQCREAVSYCGNRRSPSLSDVPDGGVSTVVRPFVKQRLAGSTPATGTKHIDRKSEQGAYAIRC